MSGTLSESTLLIHKACSSQVTGTQGGPFFCEVCDTAVGPADVAEADSTPGTLSG